MEGNAICYFAETDARNRRVKFGIKTADRSRHMYVIGKTGMGKSTLLENMAIQDIQRGDGLTFIDPHGKTAELLLEYVPESRIKDVLYFAPFDLEYPISFNVMEDVGADKRHLVVSGLMSAFKKIWVDAWSARMEYILNNVLLALLEYPDATILGVNRMLADKDYRKKVVDNVKDVSVRSFWVDEFAKYGDRYMQEAGAAIQNKVGQFISNPLIRNIIGQPKATFDLRAMMDQRKIIIVNLSKGRVGEQNANLLGSMFVTKLYLAAMSRADLSDAALSRAPYFNLYVDEFQSFANESFANILSEARKYRLSLTIAHQYIEQMSEEVRAAVFGNVGTMIVFRVGAYDAEVLEKEFAPRFTAEDIVNLGFAQIYLKLMIDGVSSPPFSAVTLPPMAKQPVSFKDDIIEWTRRTFARPRPVVEEEIKSWSAASQQIEHERAEGRRRSHGSIHSNGSAAASSHDRGPISPHEYEKKQHIKTVPVLPPEPVGGFVPLSDLQKGTAPRTASFTTNPRQTVEARRQSAPVQRMPQTVSTHGGQHARKEVIVGGGNNHALRDALAGVLKDIQLSKQAEQRQIISGTKNTQPVSGAHSTGVHGDHHKDRASEQESGTRRFEERKSVHTDEVDPDTIAQLLDVPPPRL